jgi:Protein of unknown function (DUF664)
MATTAELLTEAFNRLPELGDKAVDGIAGDRLLTRPQGTGNSIAWLLWHVGRVQDDHVADVAGTEQVWTADGWAARFALPFDDSEIGYGHSPDQVSEVRVDSPELLIGYLRAVVARTAGYVAGLTDSDLDKIVDERWDPPVRLGVRLVSVLGDNLQHLGQAAYVRGLILG